MKLFKDSFARVLCGIRIGSCISIFKQKFEGTNKEIFGYFNLLFSF